MREPTDRKALYAWWKATIEAMAPHRSLRDAVDAGCTIPPIPDEPQCGFYRRRMVRQGAFVEARIFLEQKLNTKGELVGDEVLKCQIGDSFYEPDDQWLYLQNRPITQEEYRFGVGHRRYEAGRAQHVPDPEISIDFLTVPPPLLKTRKMRVKQSGKRQGRAQGASLHRAR
jgi:hypothetical protein